jgi:hypothetical protein
MTSLRKYSLAAGLFYLLTFVSIPTLALYRSVRAPNFIAGPGPDTPVILGGVLRRRHGFADRRAGVFARCLPDLPGFEAFQSLPPCERGSITQRVAGASARRLL